MGTTGSRVAKILGTNLVRLLLIAYSVIVLLPFVWMLYNSFKTNMQFNQNIWSLPTSLQWQNYALANKKGHIETYMINSVIITAIAVVLNAGLSALISYVIARFRFPGQRFLHRLFLAGLLVPGMLAVIPYFFLARELHIYNTRLSVIIADVFWGMPFAVFLLVAFFKTLPRELEQAAQIDGCPHFQTFWLIMLPLARSGLITVAIFNFLDYWSDYVLPLTLIADDPKKPVSLGLMEFTSAMSVRQDWGQLFAACVVCILPIILVYAIFQRRLIAGLTAGSLKG